MFYQRFNNLIKNYNVDKNLVKNIDEYLSNLSLDDSDRITPSIVANSLGLKYQDTLKILTLAVKEQILTFNYEAVCPKDGAIIAKIANEDFENKDEFNVDCFRCDENMHLIKKDGIKITFSLTYPNPKANKFSIKRKIQQIFQKKKQRKLNEFKCLFSTN